ncbi:hypothetical protein [Peribacillus sp. SCS-155]|uniref:hypothetical protein n=1 Tax=Peribacillus sedimenti TaxID=3115297 RepID=UPI0039068A65
MNCLCEVLSQEKYQMSQRVAIIEDKKTVLKFSGLIQKDWLTVWDIDSRLLTLCFDSLSDEYDKLIVVYDYEAFCADPEIKEAILYHELGHLTYPVLQGETNMEAELQCDQHAIVNGYKAGLEKVLQLMLSMARSLNNKLLLDMTTSRLHQLQFSF